MDKVTQLKVEIFDLAEKVNELGAAQQALIRQIDQKKAEIAQLQNGDSKLLSESTNGNRGSKSLRRTKV